MKTSRKAQETNYFNTKDKNANNKNLFTITTNLFTISCHSWKCVLALSHFFIFTMASEAIWPQLNKVQVWSFISHLLYTALASEYQLNLKAHHTTAWNILFLWRHRNLTPLAINSSSHPWLASVMTPLAILLSFGPELSKKAGMLFWRSCMEKGVWQPVCEVKHFLHEVLHECFVSQRLWMGGVLSVF